MSKIITTESLTDYLNSEVIDAQAEAAVNAVNAWVENRTGRCWGETKQVTERYDLKGTVWLRHPDVQSVDSLNVGWPGQQQTTVPTTAFYFNQTGRMTFFSNFTGFMGVNATSRLLHDSLAVQYTYGVNDTPDDLFHAALGIAAGFYNWTQDGDKDIVGTSVGTYSVQYAQARGSVKPSPETSALAALYATVYSHAVRRV